MATGAGPRLAAVAAASFWGIFAGSAGIGLGGAALLYPILVAAIARSAPPGLDLLATAETLFSTLFLPVLLLLVCLVAGVGLFRTELEEDTLLYPLHRTVPRPVLVVGKFLGFLGAGAAVLLPSAIVGTAMAAAWSTGPTAPSAGVLEAVTAMTLLGLVAYGAFFLFLGLATRSALVVGLLYGFIWESFVSLFAGPVRQLTVVYYLRNVGGRLATGGPLGNGPSDVSVLASAVGLAVVATVELVAASLVLRYAETRSGGP